MKDFSNAFGKKVGIPEKDVGTHPTSQGFIRSKKDNQILIPLQVKNDLFNLVDENATLWIDSDGIPYKTASSVEEDFIKVSLIESEQGVEDKLTIKESREFKNRTEFKGRTRGDKIGIGSFLYDLNLSREVAGLKPFVMADFNIEDGKRLKFEKGVEIDGNKFENSLEVCKYYIDEWFNACLKQTRLKKLKAVLGKGETHRHSVLVPHRYKSKRPESRPILLSEARQYVEDKYDTFIAPPLMEADEIVDAMAARAYDAARKTGTKIMVVKAANDKDARSKRGILFDWAKSFHFNNPQCWHIPAFDENVGLIEIHKGEVKGAGSLYFAYQILMHDSADEYSPRKYLPDSFTHYGKGYGDESFYKDFAPLKTSKEVFQKVVDKYYEWFPKGLQYTAWNGSEINEDTLSYLQKHFQLAYMLESKDDHTEITDLLDEFEVDYSKLVNNHLEKVKPISSEESIRSTYNSACDKMAEISDILSNQKGKKDELTDRMSQANKLLEELWVDVGNGLFEESSDESF